MDGGSRETFCSRCIHCEVCMYKQTYLDFLKAYEKLHDGYPENIPFIRKRDPDCDFYKKRLG